MKKHMQSLVVFFLGTLGFLILGACSGSEPTMRPTETATDPPAYSVPAAKAELWERVQNMVLNDYDICQEHCGYDQACLERCEQAYNARLDREYKQLMREETTP